MRSSERIKKNKINLIFFGTTNKKYNTVYSINPRYPRISFICYSDLNEITKSCESLSSLKASKIPEITEEYVRTLLDENIFYLLLKKTKHSKNYEI